MSSFLVCGKRGVADKSIQNLLQGPYPFEPFKVHDLPSLFNDLFKFSMTLGLAVTFEKFSKLLWF